MLSEGQELMCVCVCVAEMLEESPALLETEDVEDLMSLAQYYYSKTPLSLRKVGQTLRTRKQTSSVLPVPIPITNQQWNW